MSRRSFSEFDVGPPKNIASIFDRVPDYGPHLEHFPWLNWEPVFYRGRLDGSAQLICVASDPAQTERIANRALVGDAGQRTQGFLHKIGIAKEYVFLNAFVYPFPPSHFEEVKKISRDPNIVVWRNELFNALASEKIRCQSLNSELN